jgi:hypothetical protein
MLGGDVAGAISGWLSDLLRGAQPSLRSRIRHSQELGSEPTIIPSCLIRPHQEALGRDASGGRGPGQGVVVTIIRCNSCCHGNGFDQPYRIHAGILSEGFLYNECGNLTLVWSSADPAYETIVGKSRPWMLTREQRASLEAVLRPAPHGGRWRFSNPARCTSCGEAISGPITETIYCLIYPGSVNTHRVPGEHRFGEMIT